MNMGISQLNWESIRCGACVLTPNLRLARELNVQYAAYMTAQGEVVWEKPNIFAIDVWVRSLWNSALQTHCVELNLLSTQQSLILWEQVIGDMSPALNAASVATVAEQAHQLCYLWQLDRQHRAFFQNENSHTFVKWANEFESRAVSKGFIAPVQALAQLYHLATVGKLARYERILLIGFDGISPLHQQLLTVLADQFESVTQHRTAQNIAKITAPSVNDEVKLACEYAKQTLEHDQAATVAIVVGDLAARREQIEKVAIDVFEPQAILPDCERYALPFNLSAGEPLKRIPLVRTALQLFALNGRVVSIDVVLSLLKSPFIQGYYEEMVDRAMLATKLLDEKRTRIKLERLIAVAGDFHLDRTERSYRCPKWMESLKNLKQASSDLQKRLPSQWHAYFLDILNAVGYTSDAINSIEYQQRTQFLEQCAQLETFDDLLGKIDHAKANLIVNRLVQQGVFQAKTKRSPIQILGVLEGAGLTFTHVWMVGMHDKAWPSPPRPNPFIPYHLQREKNLPHATAERELIFTKSLFEQYVSCAQQVVVSYATQDEGQELRASALIKNIECALPDIKQPKNYIDILYKNRALEVVDDTEAYAIDSNEPTRGGTRILKDQSACPFRALANHRLKTKPLEMVDEGLTKAERGTLLHSCMENVWNALKTQSHLLSLTNNELSAIVVAAIEKQTEPLHQEMGRQFIEIENQRLKQLIMVWLEIEKSRPPFTVVGTEVNEKISIGKLILNTFVDRIDDVSGAQVVIDYKTSGTPPSLSVWKGSRPDDPQLPLYAIGGTAIQGIYFAHITSKNQAFIGVSEANALIPIKANTFSKWEKETGGWYKAIDEWKCTLEKLANDFIEGRASIDPTRAACDYCHLKGLCRIELGGYFHE